MMDIARFLIIIGLVLLVVGGAIYLAGKTGILERVPLGRLPGDIRIETGNATCVVALGTSILLSIVLTVLLNVIARLLNR